MRFWKNRSVNLKLVEDKTAPPADTNQNPYEGVEIATEYSEIAKDFVTHTALTIGGVWIACKIVGRICR